jgi:hypothetical protein
LVELNARIGIVVLLLAIAVLAGLYYSALPPKQDTSATTPNSAIATSTPASNSQYTSTVTCYLDSCPPVACPSWGCGPLVTATISSYFYSTQTAQTLLGYVKVLPGTASGVYFFDVGSVQYHLVFCSCQGTGICNCPNMPALSDGEMIQVTGSVVTPSTYGPVLAPGGDIYVQTWSLP